MVMVMELCLPKRAKQARCLLQRDVLIHLIILITNMYFFLYLAAYLFILSYFLLFNFKCLDSKEANIVLITTCAKTGEEELFKDKLMN